MKNLIQKISLCPIMVFILLASEAAHSAGPFTSSGGLAGLFYFMLIIGIVGLLVIFLLLYFSFSTKTVEYNKASRIILGLVLILLSLMFFSNFFTLNYPDLRNNLPNGKNYEEVSLFNNRVISRNNGEIIIVPHDHYYPDGTRFLFSENYNTNEKGEKIYDVDIAYTRDMYDFKRKRPSKFPQKRGSNQFKITIPVFPVAVAKYKFIYNKKAYLIVPNEPKTKQIFVENEHAKGAFKAVEDSLNYPRETDFEEFLEAIELMSTLDKSQNNMVEVLINNLGWKKRTDELINKGVDVNGLWETPGRNDWSYSPLLWAVNHDHIFDQVEYLLESGADPHKQNSLGESPYEELKFRLKAGNNIGKPYISKAQELVRLMEK
jgi:energy-coupling factor transporter transmembrane protein EcfT